MIGFIYLFLIPLATAMRRHSGLAQQWKDIEGYEVDGSIFYLHHHDYKAFELKHSPGMHKGIYPLKMNIDLIEIRTRGRNTRPKAIISDAGHGLTWRSVQSDTENDKIEPNGEICQETRFFIPYDVLEIRFNWPMIAIIDATNNRVWLRNPDFKQQFPSLWRDYNPINPEFLAELRRGKGEASGSG